MYCTVLYYALMKIFAFTYTSTFRNDRVTASTFPC